ncbi:MAG: hypothetical protein GXO14_05225 [Thermococci archaeon]|nr:hypothetical protein [Thermococci archaeon]
MEMFADFLNLRTQGLLVELGVGFNFKVALRLKALGRDVVVVDKNEAAVKAAERAGLKAYVDDIFDPAVGIYSDAGALYSVRPTPELVPSIVRLAAIVSRPVYLLPFSGDSVPGRLVNYRGVPIYIVRGRGRA